MTTSNTQGENDQAAHRPEGGHHLALWRCGKSEENAFQVR